MCIFNPSVWQLLVLNGPCWFAVAMYPGAPLKGVTQLSDEWNCWPIQKLQIALSQPNPSALISLWCHTSKCCSEMLVMISPKSKLKFMFPSLVFVGTPLRAGLSYMSWLAAYLTCWHHDKIQNRRLHEWIDELYWQSLADNNFHSCSSSSH